MDAEHAGFTANMKAENVLLWTTEIIAWEKSIESLQKGSTRSPYDSEEAGTHTKMVYEFHFT